MLVVEGWFDIFYYLMWDIVLWVGGEVIYMVDGLIRVNIL